MVFDVFPNGRKEDISEFLSTYSSDASGVKYNEKQEDSVGSPEDKYTDALVRVWTISYEAESLAEQSENTAFIRRVIELEKKRQEISNQSTKGNIYQLTDNLKNLIKEYDFLIANIKN
ncbi:MAG: hypothetical protein V1870_01685 [Candidatus Aenigmatarchaeota archaeon]